MINLKQDKMNQIIITEEKREAREIPFVPFYYCDDIAMLKQCADYGSEVTVTFGKICEDNSVKNIVVDINCNGEISSYRVFNTAIAFLTQKEYDFSVLAQKEIKKEYAGLRLMLVDLLDE